MTADEGIVRVRGPKGEYVVLSANEPPPRPAPAPRESRLVDRGRFGIAGLRLEIEELLDHNCGAEEYDRLISMGSQAADVLLKIAASTEDCAPYCHRRPAAIAALGYFNQPAVAKFLAAVAADRAASVGDRAKAAISLGRIASPEAVRTLGELATDRDAALRRTAAKALGWAGGIEAVAHVERALRKEKDPRVRLQQAQALRLLGADTKIAEPARSAVAPRKPVKRAAPRRARVVRARRRTS